MTGSCLWRQKVILPLGTFGSPVPTDENVEGLPPPQPPKEKGQTCDLGCNEKGHTGCCFVDGHVDNFVAVDAVAPDPARK